MVITCEWAGRAIAEHPWAGIKFAASQLWYSSIFCCAGIVVLQFFFSQINFKKGRGANDSRHMKKLIIRKKKLRYVQMKSSDYKSYDELPLFLNAETVAKALGISISGCYELLKARDFPSITIGNRIVVPKDRFIQWAEDQSQRKMI